MPEAEAVVDRRHTPNPMMKSTLLGIHITDEAVPDPSPYLSRYPAQKTDYDFMKPHSTATS